MTQRIDLAKVATGAYRAMVGLERYLHECGLETSLLDLVRMRASQINGCAFCLDMHSKDARAAGETEQRLYLLNAWREAPFYSERERAARQRRKYVQPQTEVGDPVPHGYRYLFHRSAAFRNILSHRHLQPCARFWRRLGAPAHCRDPAAGNRGRPASLVPLPLSGRRPVQPRGKIFSRQGETCLVAVLRLRPLHEVLPGRRGARPPVDDRRADGKFG